jgi:hypothetical protein
LYALLRARGMSVDWIGAELGIASATLIKARRAVRNEL